MSWAGRQAGFAMRRCAGQIQRAGGQRHIGMGHSRHGEKFDGLVTLMSKLERSCPTERPPSHQQRSGVPSRAPNHHGRQPTSFRSPRRMATMKPKRARRRSSP